MASIEEQLSGLRAHVDLKFDQVFDGITALNERTSKTETLITSHDRSIGNLTQRQNAPMWGLAVGLLGVTVSVIVPLVGGALAFSILLTQNTQDLSAQRDDQILSRVGVIEGDLTRMQNSFGDAREELARTAEKTRALEARLDRMHVTYGVGG
ncbi:MAG: hypothetical protein V2J24_23610 [Pseudomonadales bacterium]|nr:hypothetical protein [Pseudomonadales bacterium]